MNQIRLNKITYTISGCIDTIQNYINQFPEYTIYTAGQVNQIAEIDRDANTDLTISGYVEDYRPIKEQLGISGAVWEVDYEFHIEESTKALLSPIDELKNKINASLTEIENNINLIVDGYNNLIEPRVIRVVHTIDGYHLEFLNGFDGNVDHWPMLTFMVELGDTYEIRDSYLQNIIQIMPTIVNSNPGPPYRILEKDQIGRVLPGYILVR